MKADNRPPQKTAGYLEKRGKLKFMNSWKKYWFVLEGHLLLYYGSKDDYDGLSPCKGSISLGHTSTVKPYSPVPLGFQITIRSTTITLRAESAAEQTKWMQAFVTALNPNQNTNESPTKLNHFRYSAENLSMLVESKEDFQATPNSSPHGKSPQDTPKARESPLIDRLQKLGARSYSVQNQILEGVRNSRQRSFVKETVAEYKREEDLDDRENHSDLGIKKEDVILEDDDFCVCTLGKEESGTGDSKTTKKEEKIESGSSRSFKPNTLKQELNSELIRRRKLSDSNKSVVSQILETDDKTIDDQMNSVESVNRSYNKNKSEEKLYDNSEVMKQHKPPHLPTNPHLYENVDVKQEFHLHRDSNPEPTSKNNEITKGIHAKPVRKMKNIQNLFLEPKDNPSPNPTVHNNDKRHSEDVFTEPNELNRKYPTEEKHPNEHIKTKCETKHHTYGETHKDTNTFNRCDSLTDTNVECNKKRISKNSIDLKTVPEDDLAMNNSNKNHSKSNNVSNKCSKTYNVESHWNADSKNETFASNATEVPAHVQKVNTNGNFKSNQNSPEESDNDRAEISTKKSHMKPKSDISNHFMPIKRSLEKHLPKPPTKTDSELHLHQAVKDETLSECKSEIPAPVYAEVNKQFKFKHNLNSQADHEDGLVTSSANNDQSNLKGMSYSIVSSVEQPRDRRHFTKPIPTKTDVKVQSHTDIKKETTIKIDNANSPPLYSEINKEEKLKHRMQVQNHPKHEPSASAKKNGSTEKRDQSKLKDIGGSSKIPSYAQPHKERQFKNIMDTRSEHKDDITTSGTKVNHNEIKRTINNLQGLPIGENNEHKYLHFLKHREEKGDKGTPAASNEEQYPNISENIYEEPEDIETTLPKLVLRSNPIMKSNVALSTKITDNSTAIYAEPNIDTVSKNIGDTYSDYNMTDNDLYATPNNEFNKREDSGQNWFLGDQDSLKMEELQCEMDFDEEAIDEFECNNDLYESPGDFLITSNELNAIPNYKRQNDVSQKNWKRQFQFPPPPTDDAPIYAEPNLPVAENIRGSRVKSNDLDDKFEQTGYEIDNELYGRSNNIEKNYEYPEYEEPEIICDDDAVETKAEEVEYSCIPDIDEKADNYYSRPFKTDDFPLYEDPEQCQFKIKQEKADNTKAKNKNGRQKSEPCAKTEPLTKPEETKKGDHFMQKIFKQATRKISEKSDKNCEILLGGNTDETLVMLTEIQQMLEKKKRMIKAMALQGRNMEAKRMKFKSKSADLDCRSKSYPSRSPDLLKDLSGHIGFRGLEDEYVTVCDVVKENIYSEVVSDDKIERKQRRPIGKFDTWAHGKVSDND